MAAALIIAFSGSGAAPQQQAEPAALQAAPVKPHHCKSARKAVKHYSDRIAHWRSKMGAPKRATHPGSKCPRYLATVLRRQAQIARKTYYLWLDYHYAWWKWLPDKWQRVGACETGYGKRPGSWTWDSGKYVSAFGIYRAGYTQFAHEIGQLGWDETVWKHRRVPTPREQYLVALRIHHHYGFSGWGCRGA